MAPRGVKPSPLQIIRRKLTNHRKLQGEIGEQASAYNKLTTANKELIHGKRPRAEDNDEDGADNLPVIQEPAAKRVKKTTKKVIRLKPKERTKVEEPVVESWRPVGGKDYSEDDALTPVLGIARIPAWRYHEFITSLKVLIERHSDIEEVTSEELVAGGESVNDVFVKFRSELVAEAVKEKIDGDVVGGRKLQVHYV